MSFPSFGVPCQCCFFLCKLVLLSSILINYARFTSHHRSVLMAHLISSQIANDIHTPICQLTPALPIFNVRRFYVISAAVMVFRLACATLGQRTAGRVSSHYPFLFNVPQQLLGINCIRLRRAEFYDIRGW